MTAFLEFPKLHRLSRECVVTEKIDGTNAQIFIEHVNLITNIDDPMWFIKSGDYAVTAGSRTQWIWPGRDNHGFAAWVQANADEILKLGHGQHFGEWWGSGIQRGYGLSNGDKRFSLFNTSRWLQAYEAMKAGHENTFPKCCHVVPELYRGMFDTGNIDNVLTDLSIKGSVAAPGFMKPEGVVVFHVPSQSMFKKTLDKNDQHKGQGGVIYADTGTGTRKAKNEANPEVVA